MHISHIQSVLVIGRLSQGHVGGPLYRYTGQVGPRFWDSGSLMEWTWSLRHGCGWYPPQTPSYIHIMHIKSVWAIGMLSQGHVGAPLYRYTGQNCPKFEDSGSLVELKWCRNVMVKADIHLRPLHTSILGLYIVFELFVCCLKGSGCILIPLDWPSWH